MLEIGGEKLKYGRDYYASPASAAVADSPLVFGGNGWFCKIEKH